MKTEKQKLTPTEAAKNFIRPYLDKGDTLSLHPQLNPQIETDDYSVRMKNTQVILVSKLYGEEINEEFSLKGIILSLLHEHKEEISKRNPQERYFELQMEIQILLIHFENILYGHKKLFMKNKDNWGFVGDLVNWRDTLKEIVYKRNLCV